MIISALSTAAFIVLCPQLDREQPLSPYRSWTEAQADRVDQAEPRLYEATILGRVVGPDGQPVAGGTVFLRSSAQNVPALAQTRTDANGRFRFEDIDSEPEMWCDIIPPDALRPAAFAARASSHRDTDLGDLELGVNTRISGTVSGFAENKNFAPLDDIWVSLVAPDQKRPYSGGNFAAAPVDESGQFVLEHFELESAVLCVTVRSKPVAFYYSPLEVTPGQLGRQILVTCLPETIVGKDYRRAGECEVLEMGFVPRAPVISKTFGRVALPDGTPVPDVLVIAQQRRLRIASDRTDADGKFELPTSSILRGSLNVETPGAMEVFYTSEMNVPKNLRETARVITPAPSLELILEPNARFEPSLIVGPVQGEDGSITVNWWSGGDWRPVPASIVGVRLGLTGASTLAARRPGSLPVLAILNAKSNELEFDFGEFVPHRLEVASKGSPLAGATVCVELQYGTLLEIARATTEDDGSLELAGDPGREYFAHVSAEGHRARRVRFVAGATQVDLKPLGGELVVSGLDKGEELRIVRAGESTPLARIRVHGAPVRLAAGEYDALVVSERALVRGSSFTMPKEGGGPVGLDASLDRLPRIVVRFPWLLPLSELGENERRQPEAGEWWAYASRTMPTIGSIGAAAWSMSGTRGGDVTFPTIVSREEHRIELRLPGRGRYVVSCGAYLSIPGRLQRWVDLAPGQVLELELPRANSGITGLLNRYHGDQGFSHHGIAGPRMFLDGEGEDGPGWSLVIGMPKRDAVDEFTIQPIPVGTYHLMHHLVAGIDVYGGTRVEARPGAFTTVADFDDPERGSLRVRVVDANGDPAVGSVAVLDPMSESWQEFQKVPTTARFASDAIPIPPSTKLVEGEVEVESVQAGLLELVVQLENGMRHAYRLVTEPGDVVNLLAP